MPGRDQVSDVQLYHDMVSATVSADQNGTGFDSRDGQAVTFLYPVDTVTTPGLILQAEEDQDDGAGSPLGSWTLVPLSRVIGGAFPVVGAGDAGNVVKLGVLKSGEFRHYRSKIDGTAGSSVIGAVGMVSMLRWAGNTEIKDIDPLRS